MPITQNVLQLRSESMPHDHGLHAQLLAARRRRPRSNEVVVRQPAPALLRGFEEEHPTDSATWERPPDRHADPQLSKKGGLGVVDLATTAIWRRASGALVVRRPCGRRARVDAHTCEA